MKARDKIYAQHLTNEKILQFSFVAVGVSRMIASILLIVEQ